MFSEFVFCPALVAVEQANQVEAELGRLVAPAIAEDVPAKTGRTHRTTTV
jgi:hypothetical protein